MRNHIEDRIRQDQANRNKNTTNKKQTTNIKCQPQMDVAWSCDVVHVLYKENLIDRYSSYQSIPSLFNTNSPPLSLQMPFHPLKVSFNFPAFTFQHETIVRAI